MKTFQDRLAKTRELLFDSDTNLTFTECLECLYHHYRYERALAMRRRAHRIGKKHSHWLNNTVKIYTLRKELNDL